MFNTHLQVILLTLACATIIIFSDNKAWVSFILWCVGNLLAMVGYHDFFGGWDFMTFGITALYSGIDLLPVLIALFVVPVFAKAWNKGGKIEFEGVSVSGYLDATRTMFSRLCLEATGSEADLFCASGQFWDSNFDYFQYAIRTA